MIINFGNTKFADKTHQHPPVIWDSTKVINGHFIIIGASGTGKTHRIRRLTAGMNRLDPGSRFFVLDPHGDMEIEGESCIRFSETSEYGLNPLKVSTDKHFGGVRKRIRTFIGMLSRTSNALGSKQESVLVNLLYDLYAANGFYANDPSTWSLDHDPRPGRRFGKRQPTISDLKRFTEYKLKQLLIGSGSEAVTELEKLNKKFRSLDRNNAKAHGNADIELTKLKAECKELYGNYIDAIETGREIEELIKYNSRDVIQSVFERITNLESTGLFKDKPPQFDPRASVWRYDISSLIDEEQRMFVDIIMEDCFARCREQGITDSVRTFLILDEAHKFVNENSDHIINVIAKEARKLGLGLILASQSLNHFPEDIIANTSTKIILGIDEMFHDQAAKKLRIEPKRFSFIQPHQTALIQVKNKKDNTNRFIDINLS